MAESPIAKLFAQLGFKVDRTGLKAFESDLKSVKRKIDSKDGITGATDNARKKQSKLFSEIKGNYSKVRPSLAQMRRDLKRIDGALFQNKISAEEYGEAKKRITNQISKIESAAHQKQKAQMVRIERMFDKRNFQLKELRSQTSFINRQYRAGNMTLEERRRILQGIYNEYRRIQAAQNATAGGGRTAQRTGPFAGGQDPRQRGTHGIISALHSDVGLGVLAGGFAAAQSVASYQSFVAMEQGLTAATGSQELAADEMEYIIKLSRDLGLFVGDLGKSFTGLAAAAKNTTLEGQGVRDVFKGVSAQARVLNLSAADTQGVFTAVTQIMNKGTVMAEELKNQLGERLPGSIQAAARAAFKMGVTTEATTEALFEAMEQSKLASEKFLPVFAEELWMTANAGGALEDAVRSTGAAIGRFRTNLFLANKAFNEAGFDRNVRVLINLFADFLARSEGLFQLFGRLSEYVIYPLRAFGEVLRAVGSAVDEFANSAEGNMAVMEAFVGIFLSLFRWGRKLLAVFVLLPIAISGVTKLIEEGNLSWKEWVATVGSIAGILALVLFRLKKIKQMGGLGGVLGGGAAAAGGGAAAGAAGGRFAKFMTRAKIIGGAGLAGVMAMLHSDPVGEGSDVVPQGARAFVPGLDYNTPGSPDSRRAWQSKLRQSQQELATMNPAAMQQRILEKGNTMVVHGGITFEISGDNSKEIADEVIRTIQDMYMRPASVNDPVTER